MKKEQFIEIAEWQNKTFGSATSLSKVNHLKKEVDELIIALKYKYENISYRQEEDICEEFADCFILLFGAADSYGFTFDNICEIINKKMEINKLRKCGNPGKDGIV